jgi:hypothetical protein
MWLFRVALASVPDVLCVRWAGKHNFSIYNSLWEQVTEANSSNRALVPTLKSKRMSTVIKL